MKLVDSSSWINAFRKSGDAYVRERVKALLLNDSAGWCEIVRVELWRGVAAKPEESFLKKLEESLPLLPMDRNVWDYACLLGRKCRKKGQLVPTTDIAIVACAFINKVELEHSDKHMKMLLELTGEF